MKKSGGRPAPALRVTSGVEPGARRSLSAWHSSSNLGASLISVSEISSPSASSSSITNVMALSESPPLSKKSS
jgi:hypothetical protein